MSILSTPPDVAALLERLDEIELQAALRLAAWADGFRHGRAAGIGEGRAAEVAEQNAAHRAMADRILRRVPFDELERRRWGPGGREHFGDPRPGDFPGKRGRAA